MKKELKIYLASPRGFCAGVKRAIEIVEKAINKYGAPVYVRHEIVHNKQVVDELREKGAIFVDELSEVKDNSRPVIFSAEKITGLLLSFTSESSSTNIAPFSLSSSTTCLLWTISCLTYTGAPYLFIAFSTISIALLTPAQNPLGEAK